MERKEVVIRMMEAIAPEIVKEGLALQQRLLDAGHNPADCTAGGKDLLHACAESVREWAEALADEVENIKA